MIPNHLIPLLLPSLSLPRYVWESKADGSYAVSEDTEGERLGRGTQINIYLKARTAVLQLTSGALGGRLRWGSSTPAIPALLPRLADPAPGRAGALSPSALTCKLLNGALPQYRAISTAGSLVQCN